MKRILGISFLLLLISCEAFLVEDITGDSVQVLAPTNNSEVISGSITFNWQLVDQADSYMIQIATPTFQNASQILLDSLTDDTSIQFNLNGGEYQWRIKAMNSEYETGFTTVSFSVN